MKLIYEGSVKNLWVDAERPGDGELYFEFTDAYSVFDWGRMPDSIAGKGKALATIATAFFFELSKPASWKKLEASQRFQQTLKFYDRRSREFGSALRSEFGHLCERGLATHFLGRRDERHIKVRRVNVSHPEGRELNGQLLYKYGKLPTRPALIPLEVVFRHGMPAGSSLNERLTENYVREIGFDARPQEGALFSAPILEYFSKFEETDRYLSWEQAYNYSDLSFDAFRSLSVRSLLVSVWLSEFFAERGLELWDGKLEWAVINHDGHDEVVLADSIGPDELRLIEPESGVQMSKEFLRQYYRKSAWYEGMARAKREAADRGESDWKKIYSANGGTEPEKLSFVAKQTVEDLYATLAELVAGPAVKGKYLPALRSLAKRMKQ